MPARTGAEYIAGLRDKPPAIYMQGEQIKDVTTHPGLRNGVRTLAKLYDMQHDPALRDEMTYTSPTTGDRVGLSFILPQTKADLEQRRIMMRHWARATRGMMGRTPDFLNVSMMAMAAAGDYFAQNRPAFKTHMQRYYEYVRENDLVLTHTLVNLQRSRNPQSTSLEDGTDIALSVIRETDAGIVVNGVRVLATLPLADEIAVYPARSHRLPGGAPERTSFAFAIPCHTPGLKFLCRESFDLERSSFDHPMGSRFEEMDAIAFFDHVVVPWERVFLLGDVDLCNNMSLQTRQYVHSGHQVVTKNVVKCEFMLGLANLVVQTLGSGQQAQVLEMLAEIIENLEVTKACLRAAEADAAVDQWGVMTPAEMPLVVARQLFIRMYPPES
jgi:4-hydroxyphenylacetate 3-monooxygenase